LYSGLALAVLIHRIVSTSVWSPPYIRLSQNNCIKQDSLGELGKGVSWRKGFLEEWNDSGINVFRESNANVDIEVAVVVVFV